MAVCSERTSTKGFQETQRRGKETSTRTSGKAMKLHAAFLEETRKAQKRPVKTQNWLRKF
jgi:hypothetical protein